MPSASGVYLAAGCAEGRGWRRVAGVAQVPQPGLPGPVRDEQGVRGEEFQHAHAADGDGGVKGRGGWPGEAPDVDHVVCGHGGHQVAAWADLPGREVPVQGVAGLAHGPPPQAH